MGGLLGKKGGREKRRRRPGENQEYKKHEEKKGRKKKCSGKKEGTGEGEEEWGEEALHIVAIELPKDAAKK